MPLALPPPSTNSSGPKAVSSSRKSSSPDAGSSEVKVNTGKSAEALGEGQDAAGGTSGTSTGSTFFASLSRTLLFIWGMMLKRPSRLFRPSRVSSITFLRALARRDNLSLDPKGLYKLARNYGPWSLVLPLLPPIILNTTLTTLLFTTHSGLVALLSHCSPFCPPPRSVDLEDDGRNRKWYERNPHSVQHPTLLSAVAGAGAGVVQSTLAIPVEKGVKFASRVITGSAGKVDPLPSSSSVNSPPLTTTTTKASSKSKHTSPTSALKAQVSGSVKARKDTIVWLKELRSSGIASSSPTFQEGGWRNISKLGFEGWRWGAAKDAVGYALFFATFDTSRRLALHVRSLVSSLQDSAASSDKVVDRPRVRAFFGLENIAREGEDEDEGGLGYEGSQWARVSQALVLVAGGMLAGQLFTLSTRPFDAVLKLLASPAHLTHSPSSAKFTRSYLLSHLRHPLHPSHRPQRFRTANLTQPLPAIPLIAKTVKTRGVGWFFRTPTNERVSGGWGRRLAWGALRVGPWGAGFLMFAWVGGEV